jgi:hypothetical protein
VWPTTPLRARRSCCWGMVLRRRLRELWEISSAFTRTRRTKSRSGSPSQPVGKKGRSATSAPAISWAGRQLIGEMCRLASHIVW